MHVWSVVTGIFVAAAAVRASPIVDVPLVSLPIPTSIPPVPLPSPISVPPVPLPSPISEAPPVPWPTPLPDADCCQCTADGGWICKVPDGPNGECIINPIGCPPLPVTHTQCCCCDASRPAQVCRAVPKEDGCFCTLAACPFNWDPTFLPYY
ncbi:hypothetical protein CMUS01_06986 [Colletotrichum musicola]|uniref:Uncharacterized protein n=1 Tax=Colletotrichum musicola TaxID=2175873 RepID=A0A8H6NH27_9PEZI|nr:hypothetical protein CMUS01_06986 [Colletotrichum musicola]